MKCVCQGRNHFSGCGCLTEGFIRSARINHFHCCIQADTNPEQCSSRMPELGRYHGRGVHQWETGHCSFHPLRLCSCSKCENDEPSCEGKPYESKHIVTCPLHSLAYQIECETRAASAQSVIHPEMGRGHSNLCEAAFNVLPHYRSKNMALHRLSYMTLIIMIKFYTITCSNIVCNKMYYKDQLISSLLLRE